MESFGATPSPQGLLEAEIAELPYLTDLASLRTVLERTPKDAARDDPFLIVSEAATRFQRPGLHNERDSGPFRHFLEPSADPAYRPTLLIEPTTTDWWLIDGIHRAAALFVARSTARTQHLSLSLFVLPRPLR